MSSLDPSSPYRNENDALRERKASLEAEAERLRQHAAQLQGLQAREAEIAAELAAISQRLDAGARRTLPMLDQVRIASPCNASWNEMLGDDRVRFCVSCEKNVYNLTALPREEAESLLQARAGGEICVRYYQRADGTIMTADCPVGVTKKRRKKLALAIAGAGALAFGAATALTRPSCRPMQGAVAQNTMGQPEMGELAAVPVPPVMGSVMAVPPPPPEPTTTSTQGWRGGAAVRMGKPSIAPPLPPKPKKR